MDSGSCNGRNKMIGHSTKKRQGTVTTIPVCLLAWDFKFTIWY